MADSNNRVVERLRRYSDGVHRLGAPATVLDAALPDGLVEIYRQFGEGELFHEALILRPAQQIELDSDRLRIGEVDGDDLFVHRGDGTVWRLEGDTGEWLEEGTRLNRWLNGWVDAQTVLMDTEGEFKEDVFDEAGEPLPQTVVECERKVLKRDRGAPAPRWRLARALIKLGRDDDARRELEEVVRMSPRFAWAWFDLARASERNGELAGAVEEMREAAADRSYDHAPFFLAHAARIAAVGGDFAARVELAAAALELSPTLTNTHREAARQCLDDGDSAAALEHARLAAALAPRDLAVLDLLARLSQHER